MTSDSWTSNKLCSPANNREVGMISVSQPKVPQLAQTPAEPGRSLAEASAFLHLFLCPLNRSTSSFLHIFTSFKKKES